MNGNITLRTITEHDFDKIVDLSDTLTDEQKQCVASNLYSLAQAYINIKFAWPKAIYLNEEPIGFIMLALEDPQAKDEDQPAYYLWRFMIASAHQQKGYGTKVLDMIVEKCKEDHIKSLYVSCHKEFNQPYQFYIDYGFIDTGELEDDERVLKIVFNTLSI
jgi:diamine N-acetyltransferase